MKWIIPDVIKIYEALGTIADGRIEVDGDSAKVYSSSGGKFYTITYDGSKNAIMSNDNAAYWRGYLGYPAITFLLKTGKIDYDPRYADMLKGIAWKDINVKFKNDFDKTVVYVREMLSKNGTDMNGFDSEVERIRARLKELDLDMLGPRAKPPAGY
jgi:hypothetical protein